MTSTYKVLELDSHRNGICGDPFWIARIDDGESVKIVTMFDWDDPEHCRCAVIDPEIPTIAFGENSWRGDHYANVMRQAIKSRISTITRLRDANLQDIGDT